MDFQTLLNKEMSNLNKGNFGDSDVVYPSSKLKHDKLYITKDKPELMVRILPPVGDSFFAEGFRSFDINTRNANGKDLYLGVTLPLQPNPNSQIDQQINAWIQSGNIPNNFKSKPRARYLLNVVQVQMDANNQMIHELDDQGNLCVRVLEIPQTLYKKIIATLTDKMLIPQGSDDFKSISALNAFPFRLSRTGDKLNTEYDSKAYERDLGALPQGWESFAEDLKYQTMPTEEYNKEYLDYVVAVANGQEDAYNQNRSSNEANAPTTDPFANTANTVQMTPPMNNGFNQQQPQPPMNNGFNQQQPPMNQGFNQAPPVQSNNFNQQQPPVQQNNGFNQAPPVQPNNFNTQPPVPNTGFDGNVGASDPFNNQQQPPMTQNQPPVTNNATPPIGEISTDFEAFLNDLPDLG